MAIAPSQPLTADRVSREFDLVCACCRWPRDEAAADRVRACATAEIDWERFLGILRRQRVEALANAGLRHAGVAPPEGIARTLTLLTLQVVDLDQRLAAETVLLHRLLENAGVPNLFVKGATLGRLLYGREPNKRSIDVDMLVPPDKADAVIALLRAEGYRLFLPSSDLDDATLRIWVAHNHETGWWHPERRVAVDLHTALLDNARLLPTISNASPTRGIDLDGGQAPTLYPDDLYAYLCAHGAVHGWARLKWLADLAAMLSHHTPGEIAAFHAHAEALGIGRCSAQALLLAAELFATPLPAGLETRLRRSPLHRWLVRVAIDAMAGDFEIAEHVAGKKGTRAVQLSHFVLRRDWRYRLEEVRRRLANPGDRLRGALPARLAFLYPMLALLRWARALLPSPGGRPASQEKP